jgi:lipoprotein-anchoring transpeptidase ErfK/SrfK
LLCAVALLSCGRTEAGEPLEATVSIGSAAERAAEAELEELFRAADADPRDVVPLLLEASARIATLDGEAGHALADRLEPYCRRAFFGPERLPNMERLGLGVHTVRAGELPGRIAKRYGTSPDLFGYLNRGYDARRLQAGAELKVLDLTGGNLTLMVDRSRYRVGAWRSVPDGRGGERWVLVLYVPVGLGAPETRTPTGSTRVTLRALDPEWTHPVTGVVYAPDDPDNVLGGYWMALSEEGLGKRGIGFHGYTGDHPEAWLEKPMSNGCVRMRQEDMDRVFHLALEGTPVTIAP